MAAPAARPPRDLRLDFFRGLSLFLIFVDHIPGNVLSYFTLRSVAFSDAAEAFIFISGFTAALVYGAVLRQRGFLLSAAQTYRRVWQLYVAHVFLFVIFTAEVSYTLNAADNPMYAEEMGVGDFLTQPHIAIIEALLLRFQPTFLDILPLYIVMLAGFPLAMALIQRHPLWALVPSALVYVAVQRWGWTLHLYPDEHPWFFNPLAWQFLFVIGAVCGNLQALGRRVLPEWRWMPWLAAAIVAFCAIVSITWLIHWLYDPFPPLLAQELWRSAIDKTNLSPVRLVDFLALSVLVVSVLPRDSSLLAGPLARPIVLCGQNSLYIFCLGILLAVLGHFVLAEVTDRLSVQLLVNAAGILLMISAAFIIAWYKKASRPPPSAAAAGPAE
ncbi:MAG TPA: OpgC domain-containing protein [Stellaceae bacterium]|nr:OpgC domain-containing protein [Stellaceae bacterium]